MALGYLYSKSSRTSSIIGLKLASEAYCMLPVENVSVRPLLFSLAHEATRAIAAIAKKKSVSILFIICLQIIKELSSQEKLNHFNSLTVLLIVLSSLLQAECHRQGVTYCYGLTILLTRNPLRHGLNHANGFLVK